MFKGIVFNLTLLVALGSAQSLHAKKAADNVLIEKIFSVCRALGGTIGDHSMRDEGDQKCMDFSCKVQSDVDTVTTGALAEAREPVCVSKREYDADVDARIEKAKQDAHDEAFGEVEARVDALNSAEFGDAYTLNIDGTIVNCFAGEKNSSCLKRNNIKITGAINSTEMPDGSFVITFGGGVGTNGNSNGNVGGNVSVSGKTSSSTTVSGNFAGCLKKARFLGFLWETDDLIIDGDCLKHKSSINSHLSGEIDISGEIPRSCKKRKRYKERGSIVWKYKWVLKESCVGLYGDISGGLDTVIGESDLDLGLDIEVNSGISTDDRRRRGTGTSGSSYFYVRHGGDRFKCTVGQSKEACLEGHGAISINVDGCADCRNRWSRGHGNNGDSWSSILGATAQIAGAIAPAYFMYKGQKVQANAYLGAQQAKWGAASTGFENCQIMQTTAINAHYTNLTTNELPNSDPNVPTCNGYSIGQYSGNQGWQSNGWGQYGNRWGSAGYSNGFQSAMYGPGMNYGVGMNMSGMQYNPYAGLNMQGNLNLNSLLGLPSNGLNFGVNGNSQFNNGWNGNNGNNGWNGSVGWNGNANGNWNANGNGLVPWANGNGTYWNGNNNGNGNWNGSANGNWNGGANGNWNGNSNGSANGSNWWAVNNSFQNNQAASSQGSNFQQMALQNQAGRANYNTGYNANYGYSQYAPSNFGLSLNGGVNGSWQFGN